MKTMDARKLDRKTLTELRIRGVRSVQTGNSLEDVAAVLGISRATMYHLLSLYRPPPGPRVYLKELINLLDIPGNVFL